MVRCNRCVMDDRSDEFITFDANGNCNYCNDALDKKMRVYFPNDEGKKRLETIVHEIKEAGKGKEYDCMMGLSGGLDSSYLAYLGYKLGLRILTVHIDDGFDTDISKENIRRLCEKANFKLLTITPDPTQFNALTKAYMVAGVPNLAVPQDNVLFAFIYNCLKKHKLQYFLSGGNFALECILQKGNTIYPYDVTNIRDIHRKHGTQPIDRLKFISSLRLNWDKRFMKVRSPHLLDYVDYNRDRAFMELNEFCGFEYYGGKHLENKLTAFVQLLWFPKKFSVDKRTSHLSSMIISGQMTREQALDILSEPFYTEDLMRGYIDSIKKQLDISDDEFESIMQSPPKRHEDYRTEMIMPLLRKFK